MRPLIRLFLAVVLLSGCDDEEETECRTSADCPPGQTCRSGTCRTDVPPNPRDAAPGLPDVPPRPDADADLADAIGRDGSAADADSGLRDAGALPPLITGLVEIGQFTGPLSVGRGFVLDFAEADVDVRETPAPGVAFGSCTIVETETRVPPRPVLVETVGVAVSGPTDITFSLESLVTGALVPTDLLPSPIFTPSVLQSVTFDFRAGGGTGQPADILGVELAAPSDFIPQFPLPTVPLDISRGVLFQFQPFFPVGAELLLVIRDFDGDTLLVCSSATIQGTTYVLSQETADAYFAASPTAPGIRLEIGYVSRRTEEAAVEGGGTAEIEFRIVRGTRYDVVDPP